MRPSLANLDTQVIAITGGARGIGLATAEACRAAGMSVAIGDLDSDLAAQVASTSRLDLGLPLDVTDALSFARFLDDVEAKLGSLDVLVNNAGVFHAGRYQAESHAVTERLIAANISGTATGSKLALQRFIPRDRGHLVNVASIGAIVATSGAATYSMTKHAVLGLTRALRWELSGTGIKTTVVLPGIIDTEMTASMARPGGITPPPVPPEKVAQAIVSALRSGRPEVFVPAALAPVARTMAVLGPRAGDALKRATGFDRMVLNQDTELAARYRDRVDGEYDSQAVRPPRS